MMLPPGKINLCSIRGHLKIARSPLHLAEDDFGSELSANDSDNDLDDYNPRLAARDYIAMLATCRAIHEEGKSILYENTHFEIQCSGDAETRCATLQFMGVVDYDPWMCWRRSSPEIDVFHHLQHARSISLNVLLDSHTMRDGDSWMQQMPIEISGALNLRKLHIAFWCMSDAGNSVQFQRHVDDTMSLLRRIKCKCPVTAVMETSIGKTGYQSASYYAMLDALKG